MRDIATVQVIEMIGSGDNYDENYEHLVQLAEYWKNTSDRDRNEATTRLQLIDRLLFECLGWHEDDVTAEDRLNDEYTDYTLQLPRPLLILEAKRDGTSFSIPTEKTNLEYSLPSLLRDCSNLRAAIKQVAEYCQTRGVPYAVVCNGHQLAAFIAVRMDGIPPLQGRAVVFSSFDQMIQQFGELWSLLSREGIQARNLQQRLLGERVLQPPAKLSSRMPGYPGTKIRNLFQEEFNTLSELVLADFSTSPIAERFFEECYLPSGAISQYSLVTKTVLKNRYHLLFDSENPGPVVVPAVHKSGVDPTMLSESLSRKPIILIGDVGVGKTTFIHYLRVTGNEEVFRNALTLYVDLGRKGTLTENLTNFILDELEQQLLDVYEIDIHERDFVRSVYGPQLKRFSNSVYSDLRKIDPRKYLEKEIEKLREWEDKQDEHLKHVFQHLTKSHRKQIVIIIDNADQRADAIQQEAFLRAQEIATEWPAAVFVSLRPETYHRSSRVGTLSGYHTKSFSISPPRIDKVVEARLRFALRLCSGEIPVPELTGIQVNLSRIGTAIDILLTSLERNQELYTLIENISGGDVRLALDLIRGFLGSGHVDMEKILSINEKHGSYYIPLHELLNAVMFGDNEHFDPRASPVTNLFDVSLPDSKEHFLLSLIIGLLDQLTDASNQGFVELSTIYDQLQAYGFVPDQIDITIARAIRDRRNKLIQTSARLIPEPRKRMPRALRCTSVGVYHITKLASSFAYVDAILVDTPILDDEARQNIAVLVSRDIPTSTQSI